MSTPEPQGVGAVAVDAEGDVWVRHPDGGWFTKIAPGRDFAWEEVNWYGPLTVLTHGVHPDGTPAAP